MDFFLLLLFAVVLIYLWRRSDDLQMKVQRLEGSVEALRYQLSGQPWAKPPEAVREVAPAPEEPQSEKRSAANGSPAVIPANRMEPAEPAISEPVQEFYSPEVELAEPEPPRFEFNFEDFFGRLLPIWAGGVTLAVAGFFLVRYSIEQGLLGPEVRVALGFLFGGMLLGGAEIAYRQEHRISDPRVRQALAGAGLATLYASFYLAGSQYGLIGSAIAFAGLATVTGLAVLLSFRFGLPSAILGLVGGFAAPMLVSSENANLPILALYLALVTGGLTYAGNKQGRSWLALAAPAGGLGWGALMLFSGVTGFTDVLAFGGYIVVLGAIVPAFAKAGNDEGLFASRTFRLGAAGLAAIQMATMVAQAGFSPLAWCLYILLAAALAFFAWREPRLREASAFAAAIGLAVLGLWPDAPRHTFTLISLALITIFVGVPLANIWRKAHRSIDAFQIGGFALGMITVTYAQFYWVENELILALACISIAILPAIAAWLLWPAQQDEHSNAGLVTLVSAAVGTAFAGLIATPLWAAPLVISSVTLGVIALTWRHSQREITILAWGASTFTTLVLLVGRGFNSEVSFLAGIDGDADVVRGLLRWTATALPFAVLAFRQQRSELKHAAAALASLLVYGVIAQVAPASTLAWIAAGAAVAVALLDRDRLAARSTFGFVAFTWAAVSLAAWAIEAAGAVVAQPMLIAGDIGWRQIGLYMLPLLAVAVSFVLRPAALLKNHVTSASALAGVIAVVTAHVVFKQMFALQTDEQFTAFGLAERTLWQGLLFAGGIAVMNLLSEKEWAKPVSVALFGGALAHFGLFTLVWHNPLWDAQAVGGLPLINLLLPAYGIAIGATIALRSSLIGTRSVPTRLFDAVLMALFSLLALSELRHVFAGTILAGTPVGQAEDLLRSVLGIVLAIGFLMWGARVQSRVWRVGSLVLMLAAVLKVFLVDASELDGLVRVASFVALGFSLIGIGWFYTRQLAGMKEPAE